MQSATGAVRLRRAEAEDAPDLARLVVMAGLGAYEFFLDGLVPGRSAAELLVPGFAGSAGSFSYRQCAVAVGEGDPVVGAVHAYPAAWARNADRSFLPADRLAHMAPFDAVQDWDSYFLSAVAVAPAARGQGIGRRLIGWAIERARDGGFATLSLHVWADNHAARRLYRRLGFTEAGVAAIARHPRLPHVGGSILMLLPVRQPLVTPPVPE